VAEILEALGSDRLQVYSGAGVSEHADRNAWLAATLLARGLQFVPEEPI
jgi:hypothetical protein